jgi:hypothetical protein
MQVISKPEWMKQSHAVAKPHVAERMYAHNIRIAGRQLGSMDEQRR